MKVKKKKQIHMVNMNAKQYIKIVESTKEEEESLQKDLDEIVLIVEERMKQYDRRLESLIKKSTAECVVEVTSKDSNYFIETYKNLFKTKNKKNIQNRINYLQLLIKEQNN